MTFGRSGRLRRGIEILARSRSLLRDRALVVAVAALLVVAVAYGVRNASARRIWASARSRVRRHARRGRPPRRGAGAHRSRLRRNACGRSDLPGGAGAAAGGVARRSARAARACAQTHRRLARAGRCAGGGRYSDRRGGTNRDRRYPARARVYGRHIACHRPQPGSGPPLRCRDVAGTVDEPGRRAPTRRRGTPGWRARGRGCRRRHAAHRRSRCRGVRPAGEHRRPTRSPGGSWWLGPLVAACRCSPRRVTRCSISLSAGGLYASSFRRMGGAWPSHSRDAVRSHWSISRAVYAASRWGRSGRPRLRSERPLPLRLRYGVGIVRLLHLASDTIVDSFAVVDAGAGGGSLLVLAS